MKRKPRSLPAWVTDFPIAHRGYYHDPEAPENTLAAFQHAVKANVAIELDVHLSKDGQVIVFHDETLERACGLKDHVSDLTLTELQNHTLWQSTERIPLLTDVLELLKGRVPVYVEIKNWGKPGPLEKAVAKILTPYKGPVMVLSFNIETLRWFARHAPQIPRGLNFSVRGLGKFLYFWQFDPHVIVCNRQKFSNRALQLLSYLRPCMVYNIHSLDQVDGVKHVTKNYIFEGFNPHVKRER